MPARNAGEVMRNAEGGESGPVGNYTLKRESAPGTSVGGHVNEVMPYHEHGERYTLGNKLATGCDAKGVTQRLRSCRWLTMNTLSTALSATKAAAIQGDGVGGL